jgi:hypothetical protein
MTESGCVNPVPATDHTGAEPYDGPVLVLVI